MTTKTTCREGLTYVSPELNVMDIEAEGVLCASGEGTFGINDWEREDGSVDW